MASAEEIADAYADWRARSNGNERLRKMVRGWNRIVHLHTTDTDESFTLSVLDQELSALTRAGSANPTSSSRARARTSATCSGRPQPSEKYMSGEIKLAGSGEDVMRLDAISMVAFLDQ